MKNYKFEIFTSVIEKNIKEGIYMPGYKLPSVRTIKERHNLSSSTVQSGYEYLVIKGLINSISKSGYYVKNNQIAEHKPVEKVQKPIIRDAEFQNKLMLTSVTNQGSKTISDFNAAVPGDLLIPQKLILRTMQEVIRTEGANLLRYYPANGSLTLRNHIVKHAASYDTLFNADELIITDGALQALYIALASVCNAGDVVAVESPCIFSALEVIRMLKLKVVEIPVRPNIGFDIDYLKKACSQIKVKAILLTPNFQNPTGILMPNEQKKLLLSLAQQHLIPIIENDIYGDLNFGRERPSNIKTFDNSGLVLTFSSWSKSLAPGIRLGWLSPGKYFKEAEQIKFSLGRTVAPVYQETVSKLLGSGRYDRHIRKFRIQMAKNAYQALNLLSSSFPNGTSFITPEGGYSIWAKLPDSVNVEHFYKHCKQLEVRFTPGDTFSFSGAYQRNFRMVFANQFSVKRIEAIKQAGQFT